MRVNKSQYFDEINVWAEIIGDHLRFSFFIDLNSEMSETMLIEQIIPAMQNFFPNDSIACGSSKMELQLISN